MTKNTKWISWPLDNYKITLLLVAIFFGIGIYGMWVMPKDEFPPFTIRQGVVVAVYPGATSEEVEEQVTRPLERYLFTYGEVNRTKTTSTSQNGMAMVLVHLNDEVNNKDEVWSKIKHGLALYKQSLPSGVLALVANDDFGSPLRARSAATASCRTIATASPTDCARFHRWPTCACTVTIRSR